jgi:hypothetical protein
MVNTSPEDASGYASSGLFNVFDFMPRCLVASLAYLAAIILISTFTLRGKPLTATVSRAG